MYVDTYMDICLYKNYILKGLNLIMKNEFVHNLLAGTKTALQWLTTIIFIILSILFLPAFIMLCVGTFTHIVSWLSITCIIIVCLEILFVLFMLFLGNDSDNDKRLQ